MAVPPRLAAYRPPLSLLDDPYASPANPLLVKTLRPEECPPCFDCHLSAFPCVHFTNCSDVNGKCQCPPGFGGDDCSVPLCDSLADGDQRHQIPAGQQYCKCDDGWIGNNCNVCAQDDVCSRMIIGDLPGVCYKSTMAVKQNFMQCQVTNEGVVKNLKKSAEVTFTCDVRDKECDFQFWVAGSESFYCHMRDCSFKVDQLPAKNISTYTCEHMDCRCLPKRTLCGEPGSIDLTDWMTDDEEGPTGPMTYTCVENPGDNGNHSCKFEEPHMNSLISLISKEDYFSLACVSGECLHVTQIPGYTPPAPGTAFTPFMIGGMMVVGLGIVALVLVSINWIQNKSERSQFQTSTFRVGDDGDEEMEEMHRRAMMAGHTPCSLIFSGSWDSRGANGEPANAGDGGEDSVPLLSDDAAETSSVYGYESNRTRNKFFVLEGVSGCVRPGQVMAIMGGSGAGKTTLLDILAKRNKAGIISGKILVNGKTMSDDDYKSIIGYVDQEDTLMDTLTVYETIMYSALLRLPRTMTRIGKAGSRGISGGEKRRVSIACELVTSPSILFLDEPTSGLDSYNAYNVIECLVSLARNYQRTVLFTIHQPRSNIYALFDHLALLAKGRLVYAGPAQQQAIDHFSNLGFNCPLGFNIADYLVDLTMHAVGSSGTPVGSIDPFGTRDSSDREELLFTPRHPFKVETVPLKNGSPLLRRDPLSDDEDEDHPGYNGLVASDYIVREEFPAEAPSSSEATGAGSGSLSNNGSNARFPSSTSIENIQRTPVLRPGVGKRRRNLNGLFSTSPGGIAAASAASLRLASPGGSSTVVEPSVNDGSNHLNVLVQGYLQSPMYSLVKNEIAASIAAAETPTSMASFRESIAESTTLNRLWGNLNGAVAENRPTAWTQFKILSGRTFKNLYRNPDLLRTHYVISVVVAGICGLLFYRVKNDIGGFQNRMGLFFFICALFGFGCLSSMQAFAAERLILCVNALIVLFDMLPLRVIPPIILGLICYHMIGLRAEDVWFLLRFLLVLIMFNLTAASCCMMLSIVFREPAMASLVATLVMLFEMLFGGLLLNKGTVPVYATWVQTFSFFNCALEALVVNE
ncbi:hypothetical protein BC829DRAFT_490218 [Chytridium lagenaria]|nr:hypothetical protein BC829DRAFT_490218 [Chytridium lagenaria]